MYYESAKSPEVWQRAPSMAKLLKVSQRTIRAMVARGELERRELDGRAYVRRPSGSAGVGSGSIRPDQPGSESSDPSVASAGPAGVGGEDPGGAGLVAAEIRRMAEALAQASADRAEALTLASVAARDAERERRAALEARELADLYRLRAERAARLAGTLARLPWYALAERRRLRDELVALEAEPARLVG